MIEYNLGRKFPVVITIAGSDSGGGAGIQADLKTFAALQVHGTTAITSITAQNTYSVIGIQDITPDIVEKQIIAVYEDMGIDAGKTGMLHTSKIIEKVAHIVGNLGFPLVVDPVMIAKSGARLLREDAIEALVNKLFPISEIVTPNKYEAEALSDIKINNVEDMKKAAKKIHSLGPKAVVVKGGHLKGGEAIDLLYDGNEFRIFKSIKYSDETTHGTGCSFSAAIAAFLARGYNRVDAVKEAKRFISIAIRYGLKLGKGVGPVNPMAILYNESTKYHIIDEIRRFLKKFSSLDKAYKLIPEVGMNIASSTPYPMDKDDVAAIPGRIRKDPSGDIIYSSPRFGVSDHLARYILKAREYDEDIRVAVNIKYDPKYLEILDEMGLSIGFYDRSKEPTEYKNVEGHTVTWGIEYVYRDKGFIPNVVYHTGDVGKEPMIVFLSKDLEEVYTWIEKLLSKL